MSSPPSRPASSPLDLQYLQVDGIPSNHAYAAALAFKTRFRDHFRPAETVQNLHFSLLGVTRQTVDLERVHVNGLESGVTTKTTVRIFGASCHKLSAYLYAALSRPPRMPAQARVKIDLRRLTVPPGAPSAVLTDVRDLVGQCLQSTYVWDSTAIVDFAFQVTAGPIAHVVEDALAASGWGDRKGRCRVVKS